MKEYSLCILKPDTLERGLEEFVIEKIESIGLVIHHKTSRALTPEDAELIYSGSVNDSYHSSLVEYMTRGKVTYFIVTGNDALDRLNNLVGSTNPDNAEEGTIRRLIGQSILINSVHSSSENHVDKEILNLYHVESVEELLSKND